MTTPPPSPLPTSFPDVEEIVVKLLQEAQSKLGADVHIGQSPPAGFNGTQPAVLVSRRGGAWLEDLHVDQPIIELEVYGPTKAAAHILANKARGVLLPLRGRTFAPAPPAPPGSITTVVTDVVELDGPRWQPDFIHAGANRYESVLRFVLRVY
ncbi:hypothetical protein ABZ714_08755 [Streptomyces sp. NPDC006798]|uniref:hypothetical protein n=1 Tax=Streptomyces sp. NPDC006798 TaxID=3155462 RepID=UPI0033CE026D